MAGPMRGKRARLGALAAALAAVLALAVALGVTQRGDTPGATAQTTTTTATTETPATALPANPPTCTARTLGVSRASNPGLAADCDTLLAIMSTLRVSGWIDYDTPSWWDRASPLNWSAGSTLGYWHAVTLGGTPLRVTGLDFSDTRESTKVYSARQQRFLDAEHYTRQWTLRGVIPTQLGNLTALETLDLGGSELTGAIPTQLGALTKLTRLDLGDNTLTGAIPTQLGALTKLTALDLSDNSLSGAIPTQLGNLTALTALDLSDNTLTGAIPTQAGALTALTDLALSSGNAFTGCIPGPLWVATTHDLTVLGLTTCIAATIGDGNDGIGFYEPILPGTYKVSLAEMIGEDKGFVFTVPSGLRIETRSIGGGGSLCDTPEACPTRLGIIFNGAGTGENDNRFWFCLDLETGVECGRGYPVKRIHGEAIDEYGYPIRCGGREGCYANDTRAAKYGPLIDQVVASAHVEIAR